MFCSMMYRASTTILSFPGLSKPVADRQLEEVLAVLENDTNTTTSLIENFPKAKAFQDILEEISPLPISSNKDTIRPKSVQVKRSKQITPR
ncbi:hypothetical protein AVEN_177262-1 [Araneus ventricosus]|uniref:Uncharacterized protein n=1 Tax=Araneus ventricosus TaxID=182803 RepID=A0A4Y2H4N7_ARAVE|nr:hypothetical protein AVEN_177262-1 [Araneus ventricosus]